MSVQRCPVCGQITTTGACSVGHDKPLEQAIFGKYRLTTKLGSGGFGDVYAGEHSDLRRTDAIKLLQQTRSVDRQRFQREGQALTLMSKHPHLVKVYWLDLEARPPWMAMELIDGTTLAEAIGHDGLPIARACLVIAQVADALAHVHQLGWVHRDIKPANIMIEQINDTPHARLLDLGIARPIKDALGLTDGLAPCTPEYSAPEWSEGGQLRPAYDVYSLGVCLYEAVSGGNPYKRANHVLCIGAHRAGLSQRLANVPGLQGKISDRLDNLVAGMLSVAPGDRPSASAVRDELKRVVASSSAGVSATGVDAKTLDATSGVAVGEAHHKRRPTTWGLGVAIGLVILIILAVVHDWTIPPPSDRNAAHDAAAAARDAQPTSDSQVLSDAQIVPKTVLLKLPGDRVVKTSVVAPTGGQPGGLRLEEQLAVPGVKHLVRGDERALEIAKGRILVDCDGQPLMSNDALLTCFKRRFDEDPSLFVGDFTLRTDVEIIHLRVGRNH